MNIFVSNANDSGDSVMIFTSELDVPQVKARLDKQGFYYDDVYEVADKDLQYFIYEPLWI